MDRSVRSFLVPCRNTAEGGARPTQALLGNQVATTQAQRACKPSWATKWQPHKCGRCTRAHQVPSRPQQDDNVIVFTRMNHDVVWRGTDSSTSASQSGSTRARCALSCDTAQRQTISAPRSGNTRTARTASACPLLRGGKSNTRHARPPTTSWSPSSGQGHCGGAHTPHVHSEEGAHRRQILLSRSQVRRLAHAH